MMRLTVSNFKEQVLESTIPVLVDFWSSWCPPCKMVEPIVEELASELEGRIKVGKINVDQNPKTSAEFNIAGVPTFALFKEAKLVKRETGARSKKQLLTMIENAGIVIE
ncbi:thioredoxin [Candidatus Omnitrophota bacterium]